MPQDKPVDWVRLVHQATREILVRQVKTAQQGLAEIRVIQEHAERVDRPDQQVHEALRAIQVLTEQLEARVHLGRLGILAMREKLAQQARQDQQVIQDRPA